MSIRRHLPIRAFTALVLLCSVPVHAADIPRDREGFTRHLAERFRKEVDENFRTEGPLTLGLGDIRANLDRIYSYCLANAAGCKDEVDRYIQGTRQALLDRNTPPSKKAVRLVIRTADYLQAAQAAMPDKGSAHIQSRPFVEGLVVIAMIDTPRALKSMQEDDAKTLGLTGEQVFDLGLTNLRRELVPLMEVARIANPGSIGYLSGDVFHPSRLLLKDSWAPLAKAQNGTLLAAIPTTDSVIYLAEDTPLAIAAFRSVIRQAMSQAPNPLSDTVLRWHAGGWHIVPR